MVLENSNLAVVGGSRVDGVESLGLVALAGGSSLDGDGLDSSSVAVVGVGENVKLERVLGVNLVAKESLLNDGSLGQQGKEHDDKSKEGGEFVHFDFSYGKKGAPGESYIYICVLVYG